MQTRLFTQNQLQIRSCYLSMYSYMPVFMYVCAIDTFLNMDLLSYICGYLQKVDGYKQKVDVYLRDDETNSKNLVEIYLYRNYLYACFDQCTCLCIRIYLYTDSIMCCHTHF